MTAPDQHDLFGSEEPTPEPAGDGKRQSLFFALIPPPDSADRIVAQAAGLKEQHGLRGKLQLRERLHISLVSAAEVGGGPMPAEYVSAAQAAAASMRHKPMDLVLDAALSFGKGAFVLSGANSPGILSFAKMLKESLKRYGMKPGSASAPHMTLLYDERHLVKEHPIEPIRWTAANFTLVLSHVGQTQHDHLGTWPLRP